MSKQLASAGALFLVLGTVAHSATVTLEPTKTYQTIEGFGGALAFYENWFTAAPHKQALYDTLFRGSGISILRTNNWAYTPTSNLTHDSILVAEALARNPGIRILTSSWSPPADLKANGSTKGDKAGINTLAQVNGKFVYDKFGGWWKMSLQRLAKAGIKPTWISVQNEPDISTDYESCRFDPLEGEAATPVSLTNPGFEDGATNWGTQFNGGTTAADMEFSVVTSDVHSGKNAARVVVKKSLGLSNNWKLQLSLPRWNVQPNRTYQVAFWAKGPGKVQIGSSDVANGYAYVSGFTSRIGSQWQLVSGEITTGNQSGTNLAVNLYLGDTAGTYLFDDFSVNNVVVAGMGPAIKAVADSIATLGTSAPLLLAPEPLGLGGRRLQKYIENLDTTRIHGLSFHLYNGGSFLNPSSFTETFATLKKELPSKPTFMTEYYNQEKADTTIDYLRQAWIMQKAFTEINLSAWVHWDLAWGGGSSMVAVYNPWDRSQWPKDAPQGFRVFRTYHSLAQFSRFVKPGYKRIESTSSDTAIRTVAFQSPSKDTLTLVIVHTGKTSTTANLDPASLTGYAGQLWATDSVRTCTSLGAWSPSTPLTLTPNSVTTLRLVRNSTTLVRASEALPESIVRRGNQLTIQLPAQSIRSVSVVDVRGNQTVLAPLDADLSQYALPATSHGALWVHVRTQTGTRSQWIAVP